MRNTLCERLKTLRGSRSQAEFANEMGIKQQTYANWENGQREPDIEKLLKIALHNGVTSDYLLGLVSEKTEHFAPKLPSVGEIKTAISSEDVSRLIAQNSELSHAAAANGDAHKILTMGNAELAAANRKLSEEMIEMFRELRKSNVAAPASNVQHGGGRAKTA
jgi:transcriptional regulator with XRE-family HTH domain